MPEELRFEQRLGKGCTVDLDEGLARARRVGVDSVGHKLLSGARFPEDESCRRRPCDLADLLIDLAHRRAGPDEVRVLEDPAFARTARRDGRRSEGPAFRREGGTIGVRRGRPQSLGDHRRDDAEQAQTSCEAERCVLREVHREGAHGATR